MARRRFREQERELPMEDFLRSALSGRKTRSISASSVVNSRSRLHHRLRPDLPSLFNAPATPSPDILTSPWVLLTTTPSVAVKFDIHPSANTTGIYSNGAYPNDDLPASIDMAPSGIDLHSGHIFSVLLTYDGVTLHQTVTDTTTSAVFTHDYTIDIPTTVERNRCLPGFYRLDREWRFIHSGHPHLVLLGHAFIL